MKLHPKDHKVMFALVALLFAITFVHTAAILKMDDKLNANGQKAQVSVAGCLQVTPTYNQNIAEGSSIPDYRSHVVQINMTIKNLCSYGINVINPYSLSPYHLAGVNPAYLKLQRLSNTPIDVDLITNPFSMADFMEVLSCTACSGGSLGVPYASPAGSGIVTTTGGATAIQGISLAALETQTFSLMFAYDMPDTTAVWFRVMPLRIKWFKNTALSDGIVNSTEVYTHTLSSTAATNLSSDYLISDTLVN